MDFDVLSDRFGRARKVQGLPDEWVSPYRLLWGAAYSIGIAERSMVSMGGHGALVPPDLAPHLKTAIEDERTVSWFPLWHASYMLTNAIYRVAAAAEKICYLAGQQQQGDRRWLWDSVKNPGSALSKKIPKAHGLLNGMPSVQKRAAFLKAQREEFQMSGTVTLPLVCAFIQTDIDKHVAYSPRKELMFDDHLARGAFLEACDVWDEAVSAA